MVNLPSTRPSPQKIASVNSSSFIISNCMIDKINATIINDTAAGISILPSLGKILKMTKVNKTPCFTLGAPFNGGPSSVFKEEISLAFTDTDSRTSKQITFKIMPGCKDIYGYDALLGKNDLEKISTGIQLSNDFSTKVVYNLSKPILSCEAQTSFEDNIYTTYKDVFDKNPTAVHYEHITIPTLHNHPVAARLRSYTTEEIVRMKEAIGHLVERGFIEPCKSAWSSNCRLVPKPNGGSRLVVNYIPLNSITEPLSYPLPKIEDFGVNSRQQVLFDFRLQGRVPPNGDC